MNQIFELIANYYIQLNPDSTTTDSLKMTFTVGFLVIVPSIIYLLRATSLKDLSVKNYMGSPSGLAFLPIFSDYLFYKLLYKFNHKTPNVLAHIFYSLHKVIPILLLAILFYFSNLDILQILIIFGTLQLGFIGWAIGVRIKFYNNLLDKGLFKRIVLHTFSIINSLIIVFMGTVVFLVIYTIADGIFIDYQLIFGLYLFAFVLWGILDIIHTMVMLSCKNKVIVKSIASYYDKLENIEDINYIEVLIDDMDERNIEHKNIDKSSI